MDEIRKRAEKQISAPHVRFERSPPFSPFGLGGVRASQILRYREKGCGMDQHPSSHRPIRDVALRDRLECLADAEFVRDIGDMRVDLAAVWMHLLRVETGFGGIEGGGGAAQEVHGEGRGRGEGTSDGEADSARATSDYDDAVVEGRDE